MSAAPNPPAVRTDAWTPEEDLRLTAARQLGLSYAEIAQRYLPGRTASSCGNRHAHLVFGPSLPSVPRAPLEKPVIEVALYEDPLPIAINKLYAREAKRRGTTPDVASLILNYSHAELARMHDRAAA